MTEIILAKSAGFCSGVKRAFAVAESAAEKHGAAYTIGRLVHNGDAVRILESRGVFAVEGAGGLPSPDSAAVIRSHGVGRDVYAYLERNSVEFYDATCPYVKKIHDIVAGAANGTNVIIAGDKSHPEVQGIVGHVGGGFESSRKNCFIVNSSEEIQNLLEADEKIRQNALICVAQTTYNEYKWRDCIEIIKKHCTNVQIFDTICNATVRRQREAEELSRRCAMMVVVGSKSSSNSVKLYGICSAFNGNTFFIENASGIDGEIRNRLSKVKDDKIGITAGASVPAEIIKEVHIIMNEEIKKAETESETGIDFMAEVEKTFPQKIYTGKRVKAYVIAVNANEAVVDLGTKHAGYIPADEIGGEPGSTPDMVVKPGEEIECVVMKVNDAEGIVTLSKKELDSERGFELLAAAYNENAVIEGYVSAVVNSGVIVTYEGSKVFIPASQSGVPKSGNLETLLKKTVKFKVIEVNEQRQRYVGSIRAASRLEDDAKKAKFWEGIEVGKRYTGEVKSIESYGVFVDLGGVDGMVHLSELSWKRIKHPKDAVSIGDRLDVSVKSYDPEKKRVSLTAKNPDDNPWTKFLDEYSVGMAVKATVVNITPFGAFAQIIPGIDGLIHISQISNERIKDVAQALEFGQEVDVKITEIDAEKERVSISMKALLEPEQSEAYEEPEEPEEKSDVVEETADVAETPEESEE